MNPMQFLVSAIVTISDSQTNSFKDNQFLYLMLKSAVVCIFGAITSTHSWILSSKWNKQGETLQKVENCDV